MDAKADLILCWAQNPKYQTGFVDQLLIYSCWFQPSGARSRRRRGRGGRAGVFSNIMLTSPNTSGNDYEVS